MRPSQIPNGSSSAAASTSHCLPGNLFQDIFSRIYFQLYLFQDIFSKIFFQDMRYFSPSQIPNGSSSASANISHCLLPGYIFLVPSVSNVPVTSFLYQSNEEYLFFYLFCLSVHTLSSVKTVLLQQQPTLVTAIP